VKDNRKCWRSIYNFFKKANNFFKKARFFMRRKYFLLLASEKLSIKKLNFLVFLRNLAQKIKIFVQKNA
jgi:hypothetical protein